MHLLTEILELGVVRHPVTVPETGGFCEVGLAAVEVVGKEFLIMGGRGVV